MISLKNVSKSFGENAVYTDFCLELGDGEITAVLGESGCGKTTLLNLVAGILPADKGEIIAEKPVSFVFQEDRLLPNLTVSQNLEFVCGKRDYSSELASVGLDGYENAYIRELSGGMARRLAFLRAFLFPSKIILLDEPFRNLDLKLKYSLMDLFYSLHLSSPRTTIFVTHDYNEASYLFSDRVVVLGKGGKIIFDTGIQAKDNKISAEQLKEILLK